MSDIRVDDPYVDWWYEVLTILDKVPPDDLKFTFAAVVCGMAVDGQARDGVNALAQLLRIQYIVSGDGMPSVTSIERSLKEEPGRYFQP